MSAYAGVDFINLGSLSILWRVIRHGFDCVQVLFPVIVFGEELKDSWPTLFEAGVNVRFGMYWFKLLFTLIKKRSKKKEKKGVV